MFSISGTPQNLSIPRLIASPRRSPSSQSCGIWEAVVKTGDEKREHGRRPEEGKQYSTAPSNQPAHCPMTWAEFWSLKRLPPFSMDYRTVRANSHATRGSAEAAVNERPVTASEKS
jgi:hypothetical protein